jgi:diketogulonate reductase-like aldo/keto reductase
MRTRAFGSTGIEVSVIGQGTWKMPKEGVAAMRLGIELGMTHIDTAEMYGNAEMHVGEAISGMREKVFLVSKVLPSNASYKRTLRACDDSLKRLKTDYLDVYLIHWWSDSYAIGETMRAMEDLVDAGKIRFVGVSNFDVDQLRQAQQVMSRNKIVCNQVMYHLRSRGIEYRLLKYCRAQDIAIVGYSPFGQGNFPSAGSRQGKVLAQIGEKHGRTPRQVALQFLTRSKDLFTIPKAGRTDHVRENAGGAGWRLDEEDLKLIESVFPPPREDKPLDML